MDGRPSTQGVSLRLWEDCQQEVQQCLKNPFVVALGKGTLPRSAFQHYIGQDAYYLHAFAEAFAMGMVKALKLDGDSCTILQELFNSVKDELKLHKSYAIDWGVDLDNCQPTPCTLEYTNFLLETAHGKQGVAEIVASMLPCSRLYGFLGCEISRWVLDSNHPYIDWIRTYSCQEYLDHCRKMKVLMDDLQSTSTCSYGSLLYQYKAAMKHENEFFSAQPLSPPATGMAFLNSATNDVRSV